MPTQKTHVVVETTHLSARLACKPTTAEKARATLERLEKQAGPFSGRTFAIRNVGPGGAWELVTVFGRPEIRPVVRR